MNFRVYILAFTAVSIGLVELIVGGILPVIADDLQISLSSAGQMITVFALVYAVAGPLLLFFTASLERKRLFIITLTVFFLGNVFTYFSPNFAWIMFARVVTAMSAALVIVLTITIVGRIVKPDQRPKALGIIYMGISSSLVLGVPLGIIVTDLFGWRAVFLGVALLTIGAIILIYRFLEPMPGMEPRPLSTQLRALGNPKIVAAHLATVFTLAGHYTVYAYFTPFLETELHINAYWISMLYFLFGVAAVSGGAFGGWFATKIGSKQSILIIIGSFAISIFILQYTTFSLPLFIIAMMIWGALSWSLSPPQQDYIIETDPAASDIHQSINNSAIQVGIALGSGIGGTVLEITGDVTSTSTVGASIVIIAFICAAISLSIPVQQMQQSEMRENA